MPSIQPLIHIFIANVVLGQDLEWDFPVKPRTDQWRALKTPQEREAVCQIETDKLKSLSTAGLIRICINHPFFLSYMAYDSPIQGVIINWGKNFNGYGELMKRKDSVKEIMKFLVNEDYHKIDNMRDTVEIGRQTLIWTGIELMMCDDEAIQLLSNEDKIYILKKLDVKLEEKIKYIKYFGGIGLSVTAFASRKILKSIGENTKAKLKEKQTDYDIFDKQMMVKDPIIIVEMLEQFRNYVQSKK